MKKQFLVTFAMLSLLLALSLVSVQAQSGNRIEVQIPFAFQVGDKTLPAGDYNIKQLSQDTLLVESMEGEESVVAMAAGRVENNPNAKPSTEKLVFRQYGDQYFLAQVWMTRGASGRELNKTDAERNAASELKLARHGAKPRTVEVMAH
ncbi:MAG: hypothetical protein ICV68_08020 [Pyrinomonadaceae bacterium]|nr:hypothetical protein [Pyrinomonadaceae bacterium]